MYSINYYDCTRNIKACQYGHSKKDLQQTVGPYILVRLEGLEPSRAYAHHPLKMAWHLTHIYKIKEFSINQILHYIYNYIFQYILI